MTQNGSILPILSAAQSVDFPLHVTVINREGGDTVVLRVNTLLLVPSSESLNPRLRLF